MRGFLPVFLTLGLLLSGCANDPKDEDVTSVSATTTTSATNTTTNATVPNHAPVIGNFSANATGLSVAFLIKATDADNQTLTYVLSSGNATLGNGTVVAGLANATYNFTAAGVHNVTLVVSDGKLSANRTLSLNLTSAAGGQPQSYSCTVDVGTSGFTFEGAPGVGNMGYCAYVLLDAPGVLTSEDNPGGCSTYFDDTPTDSTGGSAATVGERYDAGTELGLRCPLPGGAAGGEGTIVVTYS